MRVCDAVAIVALIRSREKIKFPLGMRYGQGNSGACQHSALTASPTRLLLQFRPRGQASLGTAAALETKQLQSPTTMAISWEAFMRPELLMDGWRVLFYTRLAAVSQHCGSYREHNSRTGGRPDGKPRANNGDQQSDPARR